MVRKFKLYKDLKVNGEEYESYNELDIKLIDNIEYVMDGCFKLFELNSGAGICLGKIVDRLW